MNKVTINKKMCVFSALSIIFVVMKHIGHDIVHEPLTYTPVWRMSAFMFISGYFFNRENCNNIFTFIKKKFKSLIISLYGWSLFYGIIKTSPRKVLKNQGFSGALLQVCCIEPLN